MNDKNYAKYLAEQDLFDFTDKKKNINEQMLYMFMRTQSMFKWSGLPDTIPQKYIELYLQINGCCGVASVNGELYALIGGLGGMPDAYYNPTQFVVANPALELSKTYDIDKDCVIIRNDTFYHGLVALYNKYASALTENELSLYMASVNTRIQSIVGAKDDRTKEAAEKYLDDILKGKLSAIAENTFFDDDLKTHQITSYGTNAIGDLIEYEQYLKASWYNELGLNANYNMKREALNSAESSINDDILFPLVDEMLRERQDGARKINEMFGTDISVELASSWMDNKKEETAEIKAIDPETEEDTTETVEDDTETGEDNAETVEDTEETAEETTEGVESTGEEIAEATDETSEESSESDSEALTEISEKLDDVAETVDDIKEDLTEEESEEENE